MSKVCLTFDCPMAEILSKNGDGNFDCSKCQKTVYDFSGMTEEEFEQKIPDIESQNLCGNYRIDQISGDSKLTWKSRINLNYHNWKQKSRFAIPTLFLGLLITCSGCKTFFMGRPASPQWYSDTQEEQDAHKPDKNDSQK